MTRLACRAPGSEIEVTPLSSASDAVQRHLARRKLRFRAPSLYEDITCPCCSTYTAYVNRIISVILIQPCRTYDYGENRQELTKRWVYRNNDDKIIIIIRPRFSIRFTTFSRRTRLNDQLSGTSQRYNILVQTRSYINVSTAMRKQIVFGRNLNSLVDMRIGPFSKIYRFHIDDSLNMADGPLKTAFGIRFPFGPINRTYRPEWYLFCRKKSSETLYTYRGQTI